MRIPLLAIAAALLATATTAQAQSVRIATEGAYAPFNFVNDSGELAGFDVEVGNAACERAGLECVWVKNDWDSIIPNLLSGNYDAIIAGMSITPERREVIGFSDTYFPSPSSIYLGLSEDADINSVVTAQAGTVQADYVARTGATLLEFPTIDETIAAVRNGEADVTLGDKGSLLPVLEQSNDLVRVGDEVHLADGLGIGLRPSDTELEQKFNAALAEMKADGSLNALIHKFFGEDADAF